MTMNVALGGERCVLDAKAAGAALSFTPSLLTRHRISGLDATRMHPSPCMYTMYGLGLTARSER